MDEDGPETEIEPHAEEMLPIPHILGLGLYIAICMVLGAVAYRSMEEN